VFFTTYKFVFLFLPVTLLVFLALLRRNRADLGLLWLMACSMVFFASLDSLGNAVETVDDARAHLTRAQARLAELTT